MPSLIAATLATEKPTDGYLVNDIISILIMSTPLLLGCNVITNVSKFTPPERDFPYFLTVGLNILAPIPKDHYIILRVRSNYMGQKFNPLGKSLNEGG